MLIARKTLVFLLVRDGEWLSWRRLCQTAARLRQASPQGLQLVRGRGLQGTGQPGRKGFHTDASDVLWPTDIAEFHLPAAARPTRASSAASTAGSPRGPSAGGPTRSSPIRAWRRRSRRGGSDAARRSTPTAADAAAGPDGSPSATTRGWSGACRPKDAAPTTPHARGSSGGSRTCSSAAGTGLAPPTTASSPSWTPTCATIARPHQEIPGLDEPRRV